MLLNVTRTVSLHLVKLIILLFFLEISNTIFNLNLERIDAWILIRC